MRRLVTGLLRSPLHRLLSGSVILLTIVGRKSGRSITFPVQYAASGSELVVFPGRFERKQWWRNLQGPATVEVLLAERHAPAPRAHSPPSRLHPIGRSSTTFARFPRPPAINASRGEAARRNPVPVLTITLA